MKLVQSELYVNIIQHDGPYWKVNNSWGFRGYKGGKELFTLFKYPTFNAGYFATQHQTVINCTCNASSLHVFKQVWYHVNIFNTGKFPPLSLFANLKVSPISTWISLLRKEVVVCTIFNQRKQRSYFEMWGSFRVVEEMLREITAWQIHGYGSLRSHPALSAEGPAQEGAALSATYVYWSRKKWKT